MAIPDLVLSTDKTSTDINNNRITVRQSERGLVLNATIKAKDGTNYDLNGKNVQFADSKDGQKLVLDQNVQIDSSQNGVVHYTLEKDVFGASGTAWFEIITNAGDVIDTTQNFYIEVIADAQLNVANDNYISSLNGLIAHVKVAGDKATENINNQVTQLTQLVNQKTQEADNVSAELTKKFDDKMNQLTADLADYQNKYNKLATDWANELKTISDKATADINGQYAQKLKDLQADYSNWKTKTVADFNATIDPIKKSIEQNTSNVDEVTKEVNDTVASMDKLKQDFDKIDFTKFITGEQIKNYYTKAEVDSKLATAGAVKTVDGINPDSKGNVQTDHYTKSETDSKLANKVEIKHFNSPQEAADASAKDKNLIAIYDMNDGPSQAVIGDQTVTIETLYNSLNSLSAQVSGLSSLQSVVSGKADSANVYTKSDIDTTVNQLKALISNAGQLKTITINGGSAISPDGNGNANLPIDINSLSNRITALENKKPIKANDEADAITKSKNSNDWYYW